MGEGRRKRGQSRQILQSVEKLGMDEDALRMEEGWEVVRMDEIRRIA